MTENIRTPDVVALLQDLPGHGLQRGRVGTVVETLAAGGYEVEFSDGEGKTYAMAAVPAGALLALHYRPGKVA